MEVESIVISDPGYTYTTSTGAIWQVDVKGHKTQILSDDDIPKLVLSWSPDQKWLVYEIAGMPSNNSIATPLIPAIATESPMIALQTPTSRTEKALVAFDINSNKRLTLGNNSFRRKREN